MVENTKLKRIGIKAAATAYMAVLTIFLSYYISTIFEEILWENERTAITAFISVAMIVSLVYLTWREKSILKLLFAYHIIVLGTAVCALISFENIKFMPFMLIPMIITAMYDIQAGLVVNVSVCGALIMGMGEYPLYIFGSAIIIIGAASCFAMNTFNRMYKNILGMGVYFAIELALLLCFKHYCAESGSEYEKTSFVVTMMITGMGTVMAANGIKLLINMFLKKRTPDFVLQKISSEQYEALKFMKGKSASLYYHSIEVAEMSRLAAKRINANYNLAYAGGLYHDFGKIAGNEYIKEGLKMADKYGLPKDVKTIMVEHNVKSRLPKSKEAAIVMLSDTAVSAIEYVKGTMDKKDISEKSIMENALNKRVITGTLHKSGLTIEEFDKIKEALISIKEHQ